MTDDDKLEWIELPPDEEATVLTSISPQCLKEDCLHCPGVFEHPGCSWSDCVLRARLPQSEQHGVTVVARRDLLLAPLRKNACSQQDRLFLWHSSTASRARRSATGQTGGLLQGVAIPPKAAKLRKRRASSTVKFEKPPRPPRGPKFA